MTIKTYSHNSTTLLIISIKYTKMNLRKDSTFTKKEHGGMKFTGSAAISLINNLTKT